MYIDVSLDRADEDTGLSTSENYYILFARRTLPLRTTMTSCMER